MISNIDRYLAFMAEANVSRADIIVFPEYGVTGTSDVKFSNPMDKEIIIVFYMTDFQPWR